MGKKILVTFASRAGSTAGVAEKIGKILRDLGEEAVVKPMNEVTDLLDYDAVVAGSPIQASAWLPVAMEFLRRNQVVLSGKPFATFTLCMTLAMKKGVKYRPQVSEWIAPVRSLVRPVSEGIFGGVLDLKKIPGAGDRLKFKLSILFGVWSEGDFRNWYEIEKWVAGLPELLN
jgi:menaquinone-dependent protoporphyrinogen oxidase